MNEHFKAERTLALFSLVCVWFAAVFTVALLSLAAGCQSEAQRATIAAANDTKTAIAAKAAVEVANVNAAAQVKQAKALVSPTAHPLAASNQTIASVRNATLPIVIISGLLLAVAIGLAFTPLSAISKIAIPITGAVACFSFIEVIALPFLPWVVIAAAAVIAGLSLYEIIRYRSISAAATAFEADVKQTVTEIETIAGTKAAPIVTTPTTSH